MKKYKSGYVLGKFLPFHLGHKYLIDTAIDNCEKVTVLVGTLPSESIPGAIRYQWVKDTYKNNQNVTVKWCNEVLPQQPEEHPYFWNIWVDVVKRYCPNDIDVIFTSENYGDPYAKHLGIKHHLVDIERKKYPVSGTLCRNETFKYWDLLSNESKSYFVKKIAIMGPESTGKSTLTKILAERFNTEYVEEYGRTVYEENGNSVSVSDFIKISTGRQKIEDEKTKKANRILLCDTEDITTYYLLKEYYPNNWTEVKHWFYHRMNEYKNYDLYLLLKPDCDWVQDGTRTFENNRWEQYEIIKSFLIQKNCNFVEIGGNWNNRFNESLKIINEHFFSK